MRSYFVLSKAGGRDVKAASPSLAARRYARELGFSSIEALQESLKDAFGNGNVSVDFVRI